MTIRELAQNWIENDRDGEYSRRMITVDEAAQFIGWMEEKPEDITPEAFAAAWNDIVSESGVCD